MSKNILVMTGSPRQGGNSDLMAEAFIEGAQKAGHTISRFDAGRANIGGCLACDTCWSTGSPCTYQDDFADLAPLLEAADVLVIVSPLYWYGFPAQLKAAIDKTYSYMVKACARPLKFSESALLLCAEEERKTIFDGIIKSYRESLAYLNCEEIGMVLAPGVGPKGAVLKTEALREARQLGEQIQ